MKKRIFALVLALALALSLAGCSLDKAAALQGTWEYKEIISKEEISELLDMFDFDSQEIALCQDVELHLVKTVTFREDKTYTFSYDLEKSKAAVAEFFRGCFDAMYESRTKLNELYGEDLTAYSKDDFCQAYAEMYSLPNLEVMVQSFAEDAYSYDQMENYENGTFRVLGNKILVTVDGQETEETLGYKLIGDSLTLEYVDATEEYSRAN